MKTLLLSLLCILFSTQSFSQTRNPAYPIIFIHGLDSEDDKWAPTLNVLDNYWGSAQSYHAVLNAYANVTRIEGPDGILGTIDDDVLLQFNNLSNVLSNGNIFVINFKNFWNENPNDPRILIHNSGSPSLFGESDGNESAIVKQGYALKHAIKAVLDATKASKVILVGHSMGGLAAREYLQRTKDNSYPPSRRWWIDTTSLDGHKVAKLITIGTPHLGSNFLEWPSSPSDTKDGNRSQEERIPNFNSEAVRDLRYSHSYILTPKVQGRYLFGGSESNANFVNQGFHNTDVDCNGNLDDVIVGINEGKNGTYDNQEMYLPVNARYTWITSDDILCLSGDCIVDQDRQWLHVLAARLGPGVSQILCLPIEHILPKPLITSLLSVVLMTPTTLIGLMK